MKINKAVQFLPFKPLLSLVLCMAIVFGLVTSFAATKVEAKSSRLAVIKEMSGEVKVQSAGGSKAYDAYSGMNLNQGDYLKVGSGSGSYAMLEIKDTGDQLTFGEGSEVYISKLAGGSDSKQSKIQMWAGSMWAKVKKLAGSDEFEVETPTAVMGVRGTLFLTAVNSETGETFASVAAGSVQAHIGTDVSAPSGNQEGTGGQNQHTNSTIIYPSQQFTAQSRDEVQDLGLKVSVVEPALFVKNASAKIIEMMVANKDAIDKENQEFLNNQNDILRNGGQTTGGNLTIKNQEDLQKVQKNLDNMIGVVVKTAIQEKKVEQKEIEKIIENSNKTIEDPNKKLDLNKVQDLDKTAGIDPEVEKKRQEELKKLEEDKKSKDEAELLIQQKIRDQLAEILKRAEEERKRIDEINRQAALDTAKKTVEEYLKQLPPQEQERFKKDQEQVGSPLPSPVTAPLPKPDTAPTDTDTTPPNMPVVEQPSNPINISNPVIKVQAEFGSVITVMEGSTVVGRSIAQAATTNVQLAALSDGTHTLTVYATDSSGNRSVPATVQLIIDTKKPDKPAVKYPTTARSLNDGSLFVEASAESGSTVKLYNSGSFMKTAAASNGSVKLTLNELAEGTYPNLSLTAVDAAGNESDASPVPAIKVDRTAPVKPIVIDPVSGSPVPASFTIKVSAELNSTIQVYENGVSAPIATGKMSTPNAVDIPVMLHGSGEHNLTVTAIDEAGNESSKSDLKVVVAETTLSPKVNMTVQPSPGPSAPPEAKQIVLSMENFTSPFYGVEVHLQHSSSSHADTTSPVIHTEGDVFGPAGPNVIEQVIVPSANPNETIYAVMNYGTDSMRTAATNTHLVTIPFYIAGSDQVVVSYILIVDKDGNKVYEWTL